MTLKINKKACIVGRKVTLAFLRFKPFNAFYRNRRGLSAVVSNLILMAAVIAVGMAALSYAMSNSNNYRAQYQQDVQQDISQYHTAVNSDIDKLKEALSFEYVFYDAASHKLYAYFINSGKIDANITMISVSNATVSCTFYTMSGQASTSALATGQEKYAVYTANPPLLTGAHTIKITTERDSTFEYSFMA